MKDGLNNQNNRHAIRQSGVGSLFVEPALLHYSDRRRRKGSDSDCPAVVAYPTNSHIESNPIVISNALSPAQKTINIESKSLYAGIAFDFAPSLR